MWIGAHLGSRVLDSSTRTTSPLCVAVRGCSNQAVRESRSLATKFVDGARTLLSKDLRSLVRSTHRRCSNFPVCWPKDCDGDVFLSPGTRIRQVPNLPSTRRSRSSISAQRAGLLAVLALLWPVGVSSEPRGRKPVARTEPTLQLKVTERANDLQIDYSLQNAHQAILVYDRQIRYRRGQPERDPEPMQRFVHGNALHLLLGAAPDPPLPATFGFLPHVTKLAPNELSSRSMQIAKPPSEYSAYLPDAPKFLDVEVKKVVLFVEYRRVKGMTLEPSPFFPGAFDIVDGEQHAAAKRIRSNTVPLELHAKRVDDPEFPRLYVPGEK